MYLKKIIAHGFKSFADKIIFDLNEGITGIVGPNGSGKSNVVDAVRWVLGEQSVRQLRGDGNMTDVIFSGSKSRNGANTASVTLIFDNTDNYFPVSFSEVSIKRRVYRDGTNEYYLNGEKCRLKDITDILLDSGIAKESFNIISQGKIEEIIASKPSERRVILEEAAGVLKYKRRKEDALRKLERTHENMSRVNDIINELEVQVSPLKEQKEQALKYIEAKEELENIEVALIAHDITHINYDYQEKKARIKEIENEILGMGSNNSTGEAELVSKKLELEKLTGEISISQQTLLSKTEEVEKLNSRKNIITERKNYAVEDSKLHAQVLLLTEQNYQVKNDIEAYQVKLEQENKRLLDINEKITNLQKDIDKERNVKGGFQTKLSDYVRNENIVKAKIESLQNSIENNDLLPYAVKAVLNNPKLGGIHNTIGNVIDALEKYSLAISIALGANSSNIIVDNELSAKEAITYLKNNNLGRATFFPLNVIKPKGIYEDVLNSIQNDPNFIGIAANLVKYDSKFHNIIQNQLGNVIVANNLDGANIISKKINHSYRIVTLDGEILHVGGSITGGGTSKVRTSILERHELEQYINSLKNIERDIKKMEIEINDSDSKIKSLEDKLYLITKDKVNVSETINTYHNQLNALKETNVNLENQISGTNNIIDNNLSKEEEEVLNAYYNASKEKESIALKISSLQGKETELKEEINELEITIRKDNALYNSKNKELKDLEIELNRADVKLDNLLNVLSETYNITYEKADSLYKLEMDIDVARNKVQTLKKIIKDLGVVNLAAPEEYDRVSVRYEFLIKQRDDLVSAENTLLEIISEMDSVMANDFKTTFEIVNEHFTQTFKELFKGGNASLKLTDPSNLLETGVEIIASPPGKKLTTISLLSGGEKTFTAISLLFAILKSRSVPFCILDEVEAALDEVNVDSFGKYLVNLKTKTQFILITHKKRTMEYAETLYGITMQESGVSKLVSVKLEEIK
ncbi:MAG: hypothetical protein E7165_00625 [Firmicutes bacterium]|nr:hypothetical protein [Bacillota bacterium]